MTFDLEKARAGISHYRIENPSNVDTESALKELVDQANLAEDALAEIERLRPFEIAARDLDSDLTKIAGERDDQAARIKSLKKEIRRLKHESKVEQEFTNSYIKRLHDAEARIKELEDAHKRSGAKYAKIINELRSSVYANIPGLDVGKIGPDAKPRSWQITEERMRAIRMAEELAWDCKAVAVLRAMLREAE